jgi:hypothetical protein
MGEMWRQQELRLQKKDTGRRGTKAAQPSHVKLNSRMAFLD